MSKCLKYCCAAILTLLLTISPTQAGVDISQSPLVVGGGAPDNLVLVPSVEWPTINSVANLGNYDSNKAYVGYFDADKCYLYNYNAVETERYFYPSVTTSNHLCTVGNKLWSGNFLNWAATQTIDPFRSAMTGGYRVKDTTSETWLEKARHEGSGGTSIFPNLRLPTSGNNATLVQKSTPFNKNYLQMRIQGLGNKMWFSINGTAATAATSATPYNPASTQDDNTAYEVSVRVKVCVPGLLEANCKPYGSYYKPEGLMQEYAGRLRYSVFGYLNHSDYWRDGAVLRAKQKSIGPSLANLNNEVKVDNPLKEWNPSTGVLLQNPSPTDASATSSAFGISIQDSGVINYLNKFGQMTTQAHKSYDPVSELFYAGLRYLRNQGNVSAYSNMTGANATTKYNYVDGFPVVTNWDDPFQASCQVNALLGIGDIYAHRDKNLPGNTGYRTDEPTMPNEVSNDPLNVVSLTNKIGQLEGLGNLGTNANFTGNKNSAYMAGLAWYANTSDLRTDLPGKQTASTYWVDVLEAQSLEGMGRNQYALAAKYGGFSVPEDFSPTTWTEALPEAWWHTNTDTLTPFGRGNGQAAFKRPDNFFVAGQAAQMVDSLKKAFERIISELTGSGASLAANSAKLESGTRVYQALFYSKAWRGDIHAFDVNATTGTLSSSPVWTASAKIPNWGSRKIFLRDKPFNWGNLTAEQRAILGSSLVVNYLHGHAAHEQRNGGTFRDRTTLLGDIVHSQPILVGKPNPKLYASKSFSGAASYTAFAAAKAGRTPTLYVGANDGMLHGFNADTGVETYALVPSAVITDKLKQLSESDYQHHYFVDGELTVADVYIDSQWKTVLVGSLGRGGKGVFALDVTDPDKVEFLWEKSATDIPALGNVLGKPLINQTAEGVWQVVFGNGANGTGDRAQLFMINISTGTVNTVDTGESGNSGLSTVNGWSTYGDGITDLFYAGDFKGNVWRIPVGGSAFKLFTAKDANNNTQPITASPLIGKDPATGKIWLFVGTGRYLAEADITNTAAQTWYGIKDEQTFISDRSSLVKRAVLAEGVINDFDARVIETGMASELVGKSGWYLDLPTSGERMVTPNFFQGSVLIGTSRIPDGSDICSPTGKGFIMAINPFTGGRLDKTFFDITGDKLFNDFDTLSVNGIPTVISGIGFDSSPNNPIFVGNIMQVVKDNGKTNTILTQGMSSDAGRTSWREIINH